MDYLAEERLSEIENKKTVFNARTNETYNRGIQNTILIGDEWVDQFPEEVDPKKMYDFFANEENWGRY